MDINREEYKRLNRERYESHSETEKYRKSKAKRLFSLEIARWVAAKLRPTDKVLDIGSGVGYQGNLLTEFLPNLRIFSLELSLRALQERQQVYRLNLNVQGDMERLPFRNGTLNAVFFFGALHHSQYTLVVLNEAKRVLKTSGTALLVEPVSLRMWLSGRGFDTCGDGMNFRFSLPFLLKHLELAGFVIQELKTTRVSTRVLTRFLGNSECVLKSCQTIDSRFFEKIPFMRHLGQVAFIRAEAR